MKVEYPENPENNVFYQYGSSGNSTGRIQKIQDASGTQEFSYGSLGEITQNKRTFVVPGGSTYSFAMSFDYDSWNRTKSITYPDGEVVSYGYNNAGQLNAVNGSKGTQNYSYLNNMHYDKYGNRVRITYGNGSESYYTYDDEMLRLTNLKTYDGNSNMIQDLDYTYDNPGNITKIENSASVVSGLGGEYEYQYTYDSLYRLINSSGSFDPTQPNEYPYSLTMSYSASGNILSKTLTADRLLDGSASSVSNSYLYYYNTGQAHTISSIDDGGNGLSYSWDANGNMTYRTNSVQNRYLCWDEENRLTTVKDNSYLSSYIYDAGGERVWKLSGSVEQMQINGNQWIDMVNINSKTLYTSPYLVVNDQEYTKHFYAESQRLASKLGAGLASSIVDPTQFQVTEVCSSYEEKSDSLLQMLERGWSRTAVGSAEIEPGNVSIENPELQVINDLAEVSADEPESDIYFYHTDHLGSSSWITDAGGDVNQHLQYLPFGKDYIYQRTNSWNIPYTFSGKEKDAETGYSYFGARYYDSDVSVWLSVDPLADKYPNESPYCYAGWNPVMIKDPDGRYKEKTDAQKARTKAAEKYGKDRVGVIYNANAGTDKEADYRFNIYKKGEDRYVHKNEQGGEYGYVPEIIISNDHKLHGYNNYSDNYSSFGSYENYMNDLIWRYETRGSGNIEYSTINVESFMFGGVVLAKSLIKSFVSNIVIKDGPGAATKGFSKQGGRQKMGKLKGNTPGNNRVQNTQFKSLSKEFGLSKSAQERLHRRISKEGYSYKEIKEIIKNGDF